MTYELVATAAFGLETVVVRELAELGYAGRIVRPGQIAFSGDLLAICRANMWLRAADRVLIVLKRFPASDFDALFDTVRALAWEDWITRESAIPVRGRSRKSQLSSVPACQRTVKKAIVERLIGTAGYSTLPESGPPVAVDVALLEDEATISLDTTGRGLHRRGYRTLVAEAQLRETLAAGIVRLSYWTPARPLIDPFCGSGTIPIEAALWGRRLAPGRNREFAAEHWPAIDARLWNQVREEADDVALAGLSQRIVATDADPKSLRMARFHAERAGVADNIHFQLRSFADLTSSRQYGCVITNPPYGLRMGNDAEVAALYRSIPHVLLRLKTWSHYVLVARGDFEALIGQTADRRRKLYNGRVACTLYQFRGPAPPRPRTDQELPVAADELPVETTSRSTVAAQTDRAAPPRRQAFGGLRAEAQRQASEFASRLRKRARHLRRWPGRRGINCYRLYERDIPEVPLVVDRYDDALTIAEFERPHDRTVAQHADWLEHMVNTACEALEIPRERAFLKHRARQRGPAQYRRAGHAEVTRVVQEGDLKFLVNLSDYIDTGLFLDHRITRSLVRDAASGCRFLNLFAYTGAFTVYAAAGGATHSTSVDLSANYLRWAQKNLQLNGFDGPQHHFVRRDALEFLDQLAANVAYELVVVDPPTFSNSKGLEHDWDVQRDHGELLNRVISHVIPGGTIFFSTNARRFKLDVERLQGVAIRDITRQTIPEDFRNHRIHRCWRMTRHS
jgi:23S rRNA (guanine2445-N2)-methyltransferase / 23S rRNA (guanine2069-N7)-methyltransferase